MQVLKFGGSSVGSADTIKQVINIVAARKNRGRAYVIVSAMSGTTDALLNTGAMAASGDEQYKTILQQIEQRHLDAVKELVPVQNQSSTLSLIKKICNEMEDICTGVFLLGELSPRTKDRVVSYGELLSSQMIASAFKWAGHSVQWKDARELIRTNANFGNAIVDFNTTVAQTEDFDKTADAEIILVPGFIASENSGATTTLGRGGSDYTASILAAALNVHILEIWTDVSGMMTADPRWVNNVRIIPSISYQEAMELNHFCSKMT